jgi:hypothetical protein
MTRYFFDTSAWVKRYQSEQGTEVIDRLFADENARLFVSRLGVVETVSALALKVRAGELLPIDYRTARKRVHGDIKAGRVSVIRVLVRHFLDAERLIDAHGQRRRLRTLDALQLSIALESFARGRIDILACADQPMCEVARLEGLSTINPLTPH